MKMKNFRKLLSLFVSLVMTACFMSVGAVTSAASPLEGYAQISGQSTKYDTVVKAIDAASGGAIINVYGTVLWGGENTESSKNVTITTADGQAQGHVVLNGANKYTYPTNYGNDDSPNITNFGCAVTFANVSIETSQGINYIFANGHKLVIESSVVMQSNGSICSGETSGSNVIAVGGSYRANVAATDMTLNAGSYEYVVGGGFGKSVTGSVNLTTGVTCQEILGGSYRGDVGGSTTVTVNGNVGVLGGVYAGCYQGDVGVDTHVTVNATVGTAGYGIVAGGSCGSGSVNGSTYVTIGAKGNVGAGVYGGNSSYSTSFQPLDTNNNQRYSRKANEQAIYPAARTTVAKSTIGVDTHVTVADGGKCSEAVYGGSANTPVNGSTYVEIAGTVYGEGNAEGVYGGGAYVGADVLKDTHVTIDSTADIPMREVNYSYMGGSTRVGGAVFGGGRFCAVKGNTNVVVNGKIGSEGLGGLVFGGGYGVMSQGTATVAGTSNITVNAAPYAYTSSKHLGWQQYTDARLTGNANYNVFWGQTGIFGGGMNSDCDAVSVININADLNGNPVYGDGLYEWITGKSTINVNNGGVVYKVFGWYDDEQAGDYYKRASDDYAKVIFNGNTSTAQQITNATLVSVTNGSAVTIDNNKTDNAQLVNVADLAINTNGKLTLLANTKVSGNYSGDGTGTLVVPAIAVGSNNDNGRLAIGGTITGKTSISIVDAGSVVPAADQVYITSGAGSTTSSGDYGWTDERNSVTMSWKSVSGDTAKSQWYLIAKPAIIVPDDPVPGADKPVIPDNPVPTTPTVPTDNSLVTVLDDDVPLGASPATGDTARGWLFVSVSLACAAAALFAVNFGKKRRSEDK